MPLTFLPLLLILVALGALWVSLRRQALFVADVTNGRLRVTHGGLAPRILADVADVLMHPPVSRATLRIVRARGLAQLTVGGNVSAAQAQQLRNVIGSVPLAQLVNRRTRPSLS